MHATKNHITWIRNVDDEYINTDNQSFCLMTQSQKTIKKSSIPVMAIAVLAAVFAVGLFVVGYDQGHIFSLVMGESAFDEMVLHELTHDLRHAAGFPCH